jgi:ABC-2 type transport system ATP-binding protein
MLELIHRTGTEFGIAVIVASHLLGEIERVCDHLVAIEGGKLLRSAPLGAFTERTGTLAVEVEEGRDVLAERLAAAGLQTAVDGPAVLIDLVDERPYDLVRDTVAELGLPLVRIEQRRHRLEDLFRDAPAGSAPLAAGSAPVAAAGPRAPARTTVARHPDDGGDGR